MDPKERRNHRTDGSTWSPTTPRELCALIAIRGSVDDRHTLPRGPHPPRTRPGRAGARSHAATPPKSLRNCTPLARMPQATNKSHANDTTAHAKRGAASPQNASTPHIACEDVAAAFQRLRRKSQATNIKNTTARAKRGLSCFISSSSWKPLQTVTSQLSPEGDEDVLTYSRLGSLRIRV